MKKRVFVGRKKELKSLNSLLNKRSASLVVIRGRRRIGKSRTVKEFARGHRFLNFSGLAPTGETSAQSQREEFARQLAVNLNAPQVVATDWSDLFLALIRETQEGRVVILFDEISWMGEKDPLFLSKLQQAWETLKDNPELILIVCSSVSVWLEENILSSTGFMGRVSLNLHLDELPLSDCNAMFDAIGFKGSSHEKLKLLSVTGGVPRYLEELRSQHSADENLKQLCFNASGILYREFEDIFHDLFTKRSKFYKAIVELLVDGSLRLPEICERLGVKKSGFWRQYLEELIQAGFVSHDYTWSLYSGKLSNMSRFRLSDNYLRFYLRYIEPNKEKVVTGLFDEKTMSGFPAWNTIMGLQFENLVLGNNKLVWEKLNLDSNDIITHGPYFQNKTVKRLGCQVDYLIQTRQNMVYLCEIKFSKNTITKKVIDEVRQKRKALKIPKTMGLCFVLIHASDVSDAVYEEDYFTHIIDFSELLTD